MSRNQMPPARNPTPEATSRADRLLTVVPGPKNDSGACLSQGTRVLDSSGKPIAGITRIELTAEVNDVWRAVIHAMVEPPVVDGAVYDVTDLQDEEDCRYVLGGSAEAKALISTLKHSRLRDFTGGGYTGTVDLPRNAEPLLPEVRMLSNQSEHELSQLNRIEAKLDALLDALADEQDDEDEIAESLDGERIAGERDISKPL